MDGKFSILIAEDDKEISATLAEELTNKQYDTAVALDGEETLFQLQKKKFDVVILDLKMPKIGGIVILKYIKAHLPSTKVIILTAYADPKNTEICKRLGADHVIGKPYDLEILFWTVELVTKS